MLKNYKSELKNKINIETELKKEFRELKKALEWYVRLNFTLMVCSILWAVKLFS